MADYRMTVTGNGNSVNIDFWHVGGGLSTMKDIRDAINAGKATAEIFEKKEIWQPREDG